MQEMGPPGNQNDILQPQTHQQISQTPYNTQIEMRPNDSDVMKNGQNAGKMKSNLGQNDPSLGVDGHAENQ